MFFEFILRSFKEEKKLNKFFQIARDSFMLRYECVDFLFRVDVQHAIVYS